MQRYLSVKNKFSLVTSFRKVKKGPPLWILALGKGRLWGLTCGKNKFIGKEKERTPQGEAGQAKERHWQEGWGMGVFKRGLLHIHLGRCGLTIWIDSYKLHNNRLYCACFSHNSVCHIRYMYIEYLWMLSGSGCLRSLENTAAHVLELEKALWLDCMPKAPVPEDWNRIWLFCSVSVSSPGLHWDLSEMGFKDQLESARLPSLLMPNFLLNSLRLW